MTIQNRAYIFKYRFVYIGWIVTYRPTEPVLYADNIKTVALHNEYELPYMTIGFTKKRVIRKLSKYTERYL